MKYRQLLAAGLLAAGSVMSLQADITTDLIAHWKFDETSGLAAADSSGRGNHAGLQNFPGDDSQWVSGRVDGALRFNVNDPAHDDFVFTQNIEGLAFDNQDLFTFAFWVKLELPEHGSNPRFISPVNSSGWVLWMPGKGVHFEGAAGNTPEPVVGQWRHYVVTLNRTTQKANVWVDGVKVLTDVTVNRGDPGTTDWIIGHSQTASQHGDHWYGKMDDVRIYNRIFTDADVTELYAAAGAEQPAPPELIMQPQDATRYIGENVTFIASASGSGPLTYQWKKGDQILEGKTESSLVLTNLTMGDAGQYSVVVTGANNATDTSRLATLTVQEIPPVDITSNLIAHWAFDETAGTEANDAAGVNDKLLLENFEGNPWVPGRVGSGAIRMNVNDLTFHNDMLVTESALQTENNSQFTFAFWLKREGETVPSQPRLVGPLGGPGWVLWMPGRGVNFEDVRAATPGPEPSSWRHFVVTYSDGFFSVYVDGVKAVDSPVATNRRITSAQRWFVGHSPSFDNHFDTWRGDIDDVRIYNRVLTQVDVAALYAAAGQAPATKPTILTEPRTQTKFIGETVNLTVSADGTAPLSYQWRKNGENIPGAESATYTLRDLKTTDSGQFSVRVTNAQGFVDSAVAVLTVEGAPVADITSGLVAHWKFDETTGIAAQDSSGNANHASLSNFADETAHWRAGRIGGAVRMNVEDIDHNDMIRTDAEITFTNQQKFTISFWLKREGETVPSNPRLVSPQGGAGWVLWMPGRGVGFEDAAQAGAHPPLNDWRHYTVVLDNGVFSVYVDGVKQVDGGGTSRGNPGTVRWILGHSADPNSAFDTWRGLMDDVRIYNRTMNAVDVHELYMGTGAFDDVHVASVSPAANAAAASTGSDIVVTLENGYQGAAVLNPSTIQMQVNGTTVTPQITSSGDRTTVTYNPTGSLTPGSPYTVKVTYTDMAGKTLTHEYAFTTANVVEVSGGGAALQQAIAAAATDTEIVVIDSLDYSNIQLLKRLYIRAAEGQNPRVVWSGGNNNNWAVWVTDSGRQATWDGIDVVQNQPDVAGKDFVFAILPHNDDSMFTLKNCDIYIDLPEQSVSGSPLGVGEKTHVINCKIYRTDNGGPALVRVFDKGSDSTFENTVIGPGPHAQGILSTSALQSGPMTIRGSLFTGIGERGILHTDTPGFYNIDDTEFGPERMFSIFTGDQRSAGSIYNISRSVFAPARSGEGAIFAADGNGVTFNFTNTVFFADAQEPNVIRSVNKSHQWKFVHCTFTETAGRSFRTLLHLGSNAGELAGAAQSGFNFQNNIFNWPGSTDAMAIGARGGAEAIRPLVIAGKNLFNVTTSNADDALRGLGTEVNGDALLSADGIHLQAGSPAIDAASAGFAAIDIDGNVRPAGVAPDLGADEAAAALPPQMAITREGNEIVLTWLGGGVLQESTSLAPAEWNDVAGAVSGYRTAITGTTRFFRIKP